MSIERRKSASFSGKGEMGKELTLLGTLVREAGTFNSVLDSLGGFEKERHWLEC